MSKHIGSNFDDFLDEEGLLVEAEAGAAKRVIAFQFRKLMRVVSDKESFKRRLLNGERACPPEDRGGLPGYEHLMHFIKTGEDIVGDDPEELRTWLGDWTPEAFDIEAAKAQFDR